MLDVGGTFQIPRERAERLFRESYGIRAEALTSTSQLRSYSLLGLKGSSLQPRSLTV